jgi:hypothetical protein
MGSWEEDQWKQSHNQNRNIHDCASKKHVRRRIHPFDLSPWWVFILHGWIIVTNQRTEEATIVFHIGLNRGRKAIEIKTITIRLVVLLVPRIINQQSI